MTCICPTEDIGVGYIRVSEDLGCPEHDWAMDMHPDDLETELEEIAIRLRIATRRRHEAETRLDMMTAQVRYLQQMLETMDGSTATWVARELDRILEGHS